MAMDMTMDAETIKHETILIKNNNESQIRPKGKSEASEHLEICPINQIEATAAATAAKQDSNT